MKTILVIEDNPDSPYGVSISTMKIMTEQELANNIASNSTRAGAMMAIIEKSLAELEQEIKKGVLAKGLKPTKKGSGPCLH